MDLKFCMVVDLDNPKMMITMMMMNMMMMRMIIMITIIVMKFTKMPISLLFFKVGSSGF